MTIEPGIYMPAELTRELSSVLETDCTFATSMDLSAVLVFPCSMHAGDKGMPVVRHLMKHVRAGKWHGGPAMADHLERLLRTKDKKILVIPNCCGQFAGMTRRAIETDYPDTIWTFPTIADYGGSILVHHDMVLDLATQQILEVKVAIAA